MQKYLIFSKDFYCYFIFGALNERIIQCAKEVLACIFLIFVLYPSLQMSLKRRQAHTRGEPWTPEEENILVEHLKTRSFDRATLRALFPTRSIPGIRSKVRKLRISYDLFGDSYRDDKIAFTHKIAQSIAPKVIFEAYAGVGHQTFAWLEHVDVLFASDKVKRKWKDFEGYALQHGFTKCKNGYKVWDKYIKDEKTIYFFPGDAIDACSHIKVEGIKVDAVDLDTCGSSLPSLPIFLSVLKPKHIIITHGEFHSLRFKREDVLKRVLSHKSLDNNSIPANFDELAIELDKSVKLYGLRAHNETKDSFWLELKDEVLLGSKVHGMLRRHYTVGKPPATADCLNFLLS